MSEKEKEKVRDDLKAHAAKFAEVANAHPAVVALASELRQANPGDPEVGALCGAMEATATPEEVAAALAPYLGQEKEEKGGKKAVKEEKAPEPAPAPEAAPEAAEPEEPHRRGHHGKGHK